MASHGDLVVRWEQDPGVSAPAWGLPPTERCIYPPPAPAPGPLPLPSPGPTQSGPSAEKGVSLSQSHVVKRSVSPQVQGEGLLSASIHQ